QLYERDHAFLQFAFCETHDILERDGVLDIEFAGDDAAQVGEMSAATHFLAEIVREAADISALRAGDAEMPDRFVVFGKAEIVNVDEPWFALHFHALAREFVKRHTAFLHGRNHGRHLHLIADERGGQFVQFVQRGGRDGQGGDELAVRVVTIRGFTELDGALIHLVRGHQLFGKFCAAPEHEHKQPGGIRVQRAAMADLLNAELPADRVHHVVRRRADRFVDQQRAVQGFKLMHIKLLTSNGYRWKSRVDNNPPLNLPGRIQGFFDSGNDAPLDRERPARDARARGGSMAATAELGGDFVHVYFFALGTQADAGQIGSELFKDAGDDHGRDGADVINEAFRIIGGRAGANKIIFSQPEVGDLVVVGQLEMVINMLQQPDS